MRCGWGSLPRADSATTMVTACSVVAPPTVDTTAPSTLATLNLDVLVCIASHLDTPSLSRLSQTCRSLCAFIEAHGWRSLCLARGISVNHGGIIAALPARDASPASLFKEALQVDQAWRTKTFRSYQMRLPLPIANGKTDRHAPQPLLLLTPLGLFLFTGSQMRLWTMAQLRALEPVSIKQAQIFYLSNPAGLDEHGSKTSSSALWDISACTQIDKTGKFIAIGRLNGLVEIIHVSQRQAHRQRTQRGAMVVNLVWLYNMPTTVQSMHACPASGLLAVGAKSGDISLFSVRVKAGRLGVSMVHEWSMGSRPWSVLIQGSQWLAIGTNGVEPIIIYSLTESTCKPASAVRLSVGTAKWTSVYALASYAAGHLLAGCYDGTLRQYNVGAALEGVEAAMDPNYQLRDRFDPSAIYCLSLGLGHDGREIAAGTARHGVCKFFRNGEGQVEHDSWSLFAAHPCRSPTYSIVGQRDRLFGVTESAFWQIDLRPAPPLRASEQDAHTLAYYRHGEMVIDRTSWPV